LGLGLGEKLFFRKKEKNYFKNGNKLSSTNKIISKYSQTSFLNKEENQTIGLQKDNSSECCFLVRQVSIT
jgi:hypothetical protein